MLLKQQNSEGGGGEKSVIWPDCSEIKFSRKEKETSAPSVHTQSSTAVWHTQLKWEKMMWLCDVRFPFKTHSLDDPGEIINHSV